MWPRLCIIKSLVWLGILATASSGAAETVRIDVDKLAFTPAQVSAHVGDTIEWANGDFVAHTATGRKKEWDVTIPAKGIGRVTLKRQESSTITADFIRTWWDASQSLIEKKLHSLMVVKISACDA
jgi:plastocyanin